MLVGKPKTDTKLLWTSDCKTVFNKTKNILSQASLLVYPVIIAPTSLTLISTVILGNLIGTYVDKCQHAFFVCISMLL